MLQVIIFFLSNVICQGPRGNTPNHGMRTFPRVVANSSKNVSRKLEDSLKFSRILSHISWFGSFPVTCDQMTEIIT